METKEALKKLLEMSQGRTMLHAKDVETICRQALNSIEIEESRIVSIGENINNLVDRFGHYCSGFYILEMALRRACKREDGSLRFTNVRQDELVHQTPGYKEVNDKEKEIIARWKQEGLIK